MRALSFAGGRPMTAVVDGRNAKRLFSIEAKFAPQCCMSSIRRSRLVVNERFGRTRVPHYVPNAECGTAIAKSDRELALRHRSARRWSGAL